MPLTQHKPPRILANTAATTTPTVHQHDSSWPWDIETHRTPTWTVKWNNYTAGVRAASWSHDDDGMITLRNAYVEHHNNYLMNQHLEGWGTGSAGGMAHYAIGNFTTATSGATVRVNTDGTIAQWLGNTATWVSDPKASARAQTRRRLSPPRINHRGNGMRSEHKANQWSSASPEEMIALQLLRQMVPNDEFRQYLKHGFVSVRGPSGLVYQINRNTNERVKVWERGTLVASLCIHMQDHKIPPTDEVVAKMLIVELDEADIWKRSNITWQKGLDKRFLEQRKLAA